MNSISTSPDLIVVGAGLVGLSVAREASGRGLRVTLLDRGEPGGGASRAAAGMLSPLSEASDSEAYLRFGLSSLRMYRSWVAELEERSGVEVEYRECGKLCLAHTSEEEIRLDARHQWARETGIRAEALNIQDLRANLPGVAGDTGSALLVHDDYRVSARRLSRALVQAARIEGIEVRSEARVRTIKSDGGKISGVLLENGSTLSSEKVLLAAGAWSGTIGGIHPVPIRPVRGQMVALHPQNFTLRHTVETEEVYLVPRDDGRLLVGATVEEVGFHEGNTAGGVRRLLTAAARLFPALETSPLGEVWSGLRPATTDGHPILGRDSEVEGLYHASGHYRNGVLLAPATARCIVPLMIDGVGDAIPEEFSPARFGTGQR
jgi:glycine oxidase